MNECAPRILRGAAPIGSREAPREAQQQQQDSAQTPWPSRGPAVGPQHGSLPVFPHCLRCVKPGTSGTVFARPCPEPRADGNPPTFLPPTASTWGKRALGNTYQKKKKKKKKRVPAEGYLMSFPVLAYDAKSTGILFQGGEESDVTRQKQGTKPREAGPQESRAGDRLRPPPVPTSRGSGF